MDDSDPLDIEELDERIALAKEAMTFVSSDDPTSTYVQFCLGEDYSIKFTRCHDLVDISEALTYYRKVVRFLTDPQERLVVQVRLCKALCFYGQQCRDIQPLLEAQSTLTTCAAEISADALLLHKMDLSEALCLLALSRRRVLGQEDKSTTDQLLDLASHFPRLPGILEFCQDDMNIVPTNFGFLTPDKSTAPAQARVMEDMVALLDARSTLWQAQARGDPILIAKSQQLLEQCSLSSTGYTHGASAQHYMLANGYRDLHHSSKDAYHIKMAVHHYSLAASIEKLPPQNRFEVARQWLQQTLETESSDCFVPLDVMMDSIPELAGLDSTVEMRHKHLSRISQEVLMASGIAITQGKISKTLEWLERGRGLVWNQLSSLRTPLEELSMHDSALAARLKVVSQRLEIAGGRQSDWRQQLSKTFDQKIVLQEEETAHVKLAKEREELIETIRATAPGFENFLRPLPPSAWLTDLPTSGPVVIILVCPSRCDAIALVPGVDEPRHIPLPDFTLKRAKRLQGMLRSFLSSKGLIRRAMEVLDEAEDRAIGPVGAYTGKRPDGLHSVLRDLWEHVVKPILDGLTFKRSDNPNKRIWWCPTGPLTSLPLHAAGRYEESDPESIFDYAVSSYIPTVSMLTERVRKARQVPAPKYGICLSSQANAHNCASIPGTKEEVARIGRMLQSNCPSVRMLQLEDKEATREALTNAMDSYSWIHLACHGFQHPAQPLESGFALADGRLELATIIKSNLKHAEFAFLSACETSTGDADLSEESVHLAAAMLVTGYRGVVGTMWSIADQYAPQVAEDFYRELFARSPEIDGSKMLDGEQAAYALHHAVQQLRKRVGSAIHLWVPYVHFGL